MRALAVAFIVWTCPGSVTVLGFSIPLAKFPDSAKPALGAFGICEGRPAVELYDPAQAAKARARVLALGKPSQLYPVDGVTVGAPLVEDKTTATIKELTP